MDFGIFTTPMLTAIAFLGLSATVDTHILPISYVTVAPSLAIDGYPAARIEREVENNIEEIFEEAQYISSRLGADPLYPRHGLDVYYLDGINGMLHAASASLGVCAQHLEIYVSQNDDHRTLTFSGLDRTCGALYQEMSEANERTPIGLLHEGVIRLLPAVNPYIAAIHHMRAELPKRSFPNTRDMIRRGFLQSNRDEDKWFYVLWGRVELLEGRPDSAVDKFQRALEIDSSFAHAYHQWGRMYAEAGDHIKAMDFYRTAWNYEHRDGAIQTDLAETLRALGNRNAAAEAFALAKATSPGNPYIHIRFGLAQLADGDSVGAVASLREAARLSPHSQGVEELLSRALAAVVPDFPRLGTVPAAGR